VVFDHLSTVQDVAQQIAFDSEPLGRFVDGQSLANDQAHCRPVNCRFVSIVFMRVHGASPNEPLEAALLRRPKAKRKRQKYVNRFDEREEGDRG
jgi:hypothetical protein